MNRVASNGHHRRRLEAEPWRRWYWTARWRERAADQLAKQPICERHLKRGEIVPATVAHHRIRHRGDPVLFWEGKLESACKACHDGIIKAEEIRGYEIGCDTSGRPIDPGHPWNRERAGQD